MTSTETPVSQAGGQADSPERHFLYFADPMCSWCYGFSPVMAKLQHAFKGRLGVRIVVGGLRAGNTQAMRAQDRDYIRNAWTRVAEASGQSFDHTFFDRENFVYDTEPACRAIVTMRNLHPGRELELKAAISRAFYGNNRDTTDADVLIDLAVELGADRDAFAAAFSSADIRNETMRDFHFAQQSGVQGFPCLVVGREQDGYALITNGFRPIDGLVDAVEGWLAQQDDGEAGSASRN